MRKNIVAPDRPQMTIWRMRTACCVPVYKHTLTICNIYCFSAAKLHERASILRYTYIACPVKLLVFLCFIILYHFVS